MAWESADFLVNYVNTLLVVAGMLSVQCVTVSLAGYAFARLRFPGRDLFFYAFLLQLMLVPPALIVPNLRTVVDLGLYDTLPGVMAPYFASAFGTFLMRQTFLALPRDFEEAAAIDGAPWWAIIWYVLLPHGQARPGRLRHRLDHRALERVSVAADGDQQPSNQTLTIGLASFAMGCRGRQGMGRAGRRHAPRHGAAGGGVRRLPAPLRRQLRFQWSES